MVKANFDHIYTATDPRPYFQTLGALDYQIPAHGASVFGTVANQVAEVRELDTIRIADLCCSYGINAAVMKHDATFEEIVDHYTSEDCHSLERPDLLARDREFFGERIDGQTLEVVGIDQSPEAISYAVEAGILDDGAAEDLEANEPSPELVGLLEETDLITVSGGIGYITERTVARVLDAAPTRPWLAALCLRWVDFDPVAEVGRARDMIVHRLEEVTFPQRRFFDAAEQEHVLKELDRMGVEAAGREADGYHHSELFVLHPADEELPSPIEELVGPGA
jgi:hypothetical protein